MNNQKSFNSIWTDNLARHKHPNGNALIDHLRTIHQEHAGFTEECASSCRDRVGRNSYEWLAELVPNNEVSNVLDLACGSGPLLKILFDRNKNLNLKGIDMSPEELALAKIRLKNSGTSLIETNAQNLKIINDNSIDIVLCHWALTLMDPIDPVLNEVKRVLTHKGQFAAIVDGPMNIAPGYKKVHDLIYSYVQEEIPSYGKIDLGDPRIRRSESLSILVHKIFPGANVTIETNVVSIEGPVTQIAEIAAGFFYAAFVLKPEKRKLMITSLSKILTVSKQSNHIQRLGRFSMPISRLLVVPNIK